MRYLMMSIVGLMLLGCATAQIEQRVETLEKITVGQEQLIQDHETVLLGLIDIIKQLKKGLLL